MTVSDMDRAADDLSIHRQAVCWAVEVLLPVLRLGLENTSGWRLLQRLGLKAAVKLLEEYQASRCAGH